MVSGVPPSKNKIKLPIRKNTKPIGSPIECSFPRSVLSGKHRSSDIKIMIKNKKGKPIRLGVQCVVLNDSDFLEATIRMFQPFVDKILISINEKSWLNDIKNNGKSEEVALRLKKEFSNINIDKGNWNNESDQRNDSLNKLRECDYVFIVDADEFWPTEGIHNAVDFALNHIGYSVFMANWNTRFKNVNWRVEPRESFKPVVLVKNNGLKFKKARMIMEGENASFITIPEKNLIIEHFSYVRGTDLQIKEKISAFSHANEIVNGPEWWYQNVYLQADLNSKNVHPTLPEAYQGLVVDVIHPEILGFLQKYSPSILKKKD